MIYYSLPDLTVDYYLFHCQSIPTVDVTVWRYHSNFLSSMVVAQGPNFVRLFARFCQQRLHVPKKMTGKFGVRFCPVRESKNTIYLYKSDRIGVYKIGVAIRIRPIFGPRIRIRNLNCVFGLLISMIFVGLKCDRQKTKTHFIDT